MLHAAELVIPHPRSGETMRFRANPPADFAGLSKSLLGWSEGQADEAEDEAASLLDFCLDGRGSCRCLLDD